MLPTARIIVRHIFPNSVASIVVYATMNIGGAILTESALSFLGMGVVPPDPSWGTLIQDGQQYLQTQALAHDSTGSRDPLHGARVHPAG